MALSPGRPRKHRELGDIEDLPVINEFSQDALDNEEPPDIENFLAELGIQGKQYSCQIKQFPAEGGGTPAFMPSNYKGKYPTIDELGTKYGPGKYLYVFTWAVPRSDGSGPKRAMKELEVMLSDAWDDAHQEYLYQYSLKRRKRLRQIKDKAELDGVLYTNERGDGNGTRGSMDDLVEAKNKLVSLGVPFGSGGGTDMVSGNTGGIFALIMGMQQKSTELMVQMMTSSQQQMMALVTAVLSNNSNNQNPYGNMFKEVAGMMTQMVDLKQALNPEKQTMVDKIFALLETVSPQVLGLLKMSSAQRRSDPLYKLAAGSQELKNLKGDPEATDALATRLDAHYGVQNTNDIMTVMGLSRSEGMKAKLRGMGYPTEPRQAPAAAQEVPADVIEPDPEETSANGIAEAHPGLVTPEDDTGLEGDDPDEEVE